MSARRSRPEATAMPSRSATPPEAVVVRDFAQILLNALASRDIDKVAGFFADDAVVMMSDSPQAVGELEVRALWSGLINRPDFALTLESFKTDASRDIDMASDVGTYTLKGRAASPERGRYLIVWRRTGVQWKVIAAMFTATAPHAAGRMSVMGMKAQG
jgi:ketosteroid isomerase-like protein